MNVFRRNKMGMSSSFRTPKKNANRKAKICYSEDEGGESPREDDHKVRYHEEDPSELQAAKARRPRRHTTGGSNKDAIEKAKQMIADDPSIDTKKHANNLGTLDRKQLVSMLKTRYGDDIEKYRSLKKHETLEVDHRNLVENGLPKRQTSHKTLSYKTSSGGDGGSTSGSVRRNSLSSQESSQTSQESIPYSASPPKYDSHSAKAMQAAALQQYAQRNRKVSNGSSIQSGYSSYSEDPHNVTQVITQRTTVVTKQQQQPHLQHQQLQQQQTLHQNEVQQQPLREEQLRKFDELQQREQEVLHTERQKQLQYSQVEQQQTLDQDRVLFLQYKDEIKRVNMPNSITSLDTLKALFVTSFPGKLSMVRIDERGLIYIKDKEADIFYELEDLRDIQPRSHVQIRERLSYDSLASSQSDMNSHDNRYNHSSTTYHYATMPHHGRRPNQQQQYAESLQDFPTSRPRSGSGSSLRSDSVLTRPQRNAEPPAEKTTYVNSGFLSPRNSRKETRIEKTEKTRYEIKPIRKESEKKGQSDGQQYVEPPVLKSRKQSEKEKQKKGPSVEEQLADLTKLLHTAIHSDEEDSGFSEQVRAPGKLDPHVIDNLNALSADNYSKSPTKSRAYAPTALLQSKKREVEGPSDENYFKYDSHSYSKAVDIPGMSREDSLEETEKGYMHDGPDQYMKSPKKVYDFDSDDGPNQYIKSPKKVDDFDSDREYESGLADTLLKSLQSPTSSTSSRASTSVRISSSGVSSSGSYVTSPPPTPARKPSSKIAVQTIKPSMSPTKRQEQHTWSSTTTTTKQGQFKMDRMIGIASSAASLRNSILTLRSQLDELRLLQTNQSRNFKIFMTQSLNDFNSLANTVSQNIRKSQGNGHSIRDRRSRVQEDYDGYVKRQQNASDHLSQLEDDTERLRRDVVQRKRVLEAHHVTKLNSDLESLGKILAELKSRFSGLHDMLKIVMAGELEIIVSEERFLKDEPSNLDNLYARCKHLSGTLFTLQRLANVQQMARSNDQQDINQNRVQVKVNQRGPASSSDEVPHQRTSTSSSSRSVRFTSDGRSGFL